MNILKTLKLADYFTIGNFISGFLSIYFSFIIMPKIAAIFLILAFIFDSLDGRIARLKKQENDFGKELDSLSDLVSFGVAPAVLGFAIGLNSNWQIAILALFATCGMLRLARFNVLKVKHFIGVPITVNGILFPLLIFLGVSNIIFIISYAIMALLMISDIKIKKV